MSICPFCGLAFHVDGRFGYFEVDKTGKRVHVDTCERCHAALMNLVLLQKLGRYRRGDPRKLLREELRQHESGIR
jgi:Zn-finger nucleic acid-binding protein